MIDAIKQGDELAYEQAYILYRQKVYAYFFKKTTSSEDAKDLLQITFFKLWKYRSSLNNTYSLEQHLFHIARTVYIDHLRAENKAAKIKKAVTETSREVSSTSINFDVNASLQNALSSMPELRKKVFQLIRLQGYSYKEVAEMLSISVKSVDNNLTKALRHLKKVFMLLLIILLSI
ncbi:MAG: RNA polymerase sigma factor [Ilyomonas sp.]